VIFFHIWAWRTQTGRDIILAKFLATWIPDVSSYERPN